MIKHNFDQLNFGQPTPCHPLMFLLRLFFSFHHWCSDSPCHKKVFLSLSSLPVSLFLCMSVSVSFSISFSVLIFSFLTMSSFVLFCFLSYWFISDILLLRDFLFKFFYFYLFYSLCLSIEWTIQHFFLESEKAFYIPPPTDLLTLRTKTRYSLFVVLFCFVVKTVYQRQLSKIRQVCSSSFSF